MATVRDVARRAGVSPSTASIVLGGRAQQRHISEQTCQKVEQAARELGYTSSLEARSLRGQGGPGPLKVALFWADDRRIVYLTRFLQGAFPELPARNMALEVLPYTPGALSRQEALTGGQRFHAAILANAGEQDLQWLQGQSLPFPLVVYNRAAAGYPCVHSDDRQIGQAAARLLLQRGKRRVAVLTSHPHWKEIALREEQLQKTLGPAGEPVLLLGCDGLRGAAGAAPAGNPGAAGYGSAGGGKRRSRLPGCLPGAVDGRAGTHRRDGPPVPAFGGKAAAPGGSGGCPGTGPGRGTAVAVKEACARLFGPV